jgi:hypothetical protein
MAEAIAPAPARRRRRVGGGLIFVGAILFAVMVLRMLAHVEPIEVVNSRLDRAGAEVAVEGLIRNTGSDSDAVSIEVRYFDGEGRKLAEDRVPLAPLASGAETGFKSRLRRLDDVRDFTIYIDRGRNPYGN